jgi:peptide/nickel transport system permease protein
MRRVACLIATLLVVAAAAFAIPRALPGDPATTTLFQQGAPVTAEAVADLNARAGFDRPLAVQFGTWVGGLLTGDWGRSIRTGEPITTGLARRLPVSLAIGLGGLALGAGLAYGLGIAAAAGVAGADGLGRVLAILAQALPAFAFGILVIYLFGVELRWIRPFTGGPLERIGLPMAIVALYSCGSLSRLVRRQTSAAMASPFFVTARAKGLSRYQAVLRHAGPFGLLGLVAALRPEAAWVIGGTAVVEVLFGAPGVSVWVVDSIGYRDWQVLQAYVLVIALWLAAAHVVADATLNWLDPRIGR